MFNGVENWNRFVLDRMNYFKRIGDMTSYYYWREMFL